LTRGHGDTVTGGNNKGQMVLDLQTPLEGEIYFQRVMRYETQAISGN